MTHPPADRCRLCTTDDDLAAVMLPRRGDVPPKFHLGTDCPNPRSAA